MISKALVAASVKPIVLAMLMSGEHYGYQILKRIQDVSGGRLDWSDAMLYPVLHRMEKDGLVSSQWKISDNNRMRKYYKITACGHEELNREREQWLCVHNAMQHFHAAVPVHNR